jgi:hypothetical protein
MTTQKQRAANRRNAKKSTGPKTVKGRDRSKLNALKHGLTAAQIIVFDENAEDLEKFHQGLIEELVPTGALEEQLVERIAVCAWRLRRVYRIEARLFAAAGKPVLEPQEAEITFSVFTEDVDLSVFTDEELAVLQKLSEQMSSTNTIGKEAPSTKTAAAPSHKTASTDGAAEAPREAASAGSTAVAPPETVFDIGAVFRTLAVSQGPLFQLSRHETTIERSLHRALHDLERLQARRKGEAVMAPVALDISSGG